MLFLHHKNIFSGVPIDCLRDCKLAFTSKCLTVSSYAVTWVFSLYKYLQFFNFRYHFQFEYELFETFVDKQNVDSNFTRQQFNQHQDYSSVICHLSVIFFLHYRIQKFVFCSIQAFNNFAHQLMLLSIFLYYIQKDSYTVFSSQIHNELRKISSVTLMPVVGLQTFKVELFPKTHCGAII